MGIQAIPPSDWIDLNQVDRVYPFSKRTAWKWIAEGRLTAYRPFKKKVVLRRSEIDRLLEATRVDLNIDRIVTELVQEATSK